MENEREWQLENERNEKGELIKMSILIRNMFYENRLCKYNCTYLLP